VPTQLIVHTGQYHLPTRPSTVKDRIQRYLERFDRYLKPPAASANRPANCLTESQLARAIHGADAAAQSEKCDSQHSRFWANP
jgi:hypothetical protein